MVLAAGCVPAVNNQPVQQPVIQQPPLFPPQNAMQNGDYAGFLTENENTLKTCQEPEQCAAALFNVAFLYCYPKSPYYNPVKGTKYVEDLISGSPESPWAYQAQIWVELIKKSKVEGRKRQPREEGKQREASANEAGKQADSQPDKQAEGQQDKQVENQQDKQIEDPTDNKAEADRRQLQEEIRSKDATIKELNRQIERSRQIDIEIDKKERGLY
jgi:hypothetical protein